MKDSIAHNPPFPKNYADEFLVLDHGKGVWLWDLAGRKYLDFTAGIAVTALGHGRADLAKAASDQMKKLIHVSNLYTTEPALVLAEKLVKTGPFAAVHLGNSGTEANEGAIKYARVYALRTKGEGHHRLMSFTGAFHGRTLGALSLTPTEKYQKPYHPLLPGVETGIYNDPESLRRLDRSFAAVLIEPLQGEGGLSALTPEFARELQETCARHDILIIADEIQCGLGRTGTFFASEQLGLVPDIVTLAKPLAGGLPLSATLIPAKVNDLVHVGDHGSTFGGGPVTTAVASIVVDKIMDPAFLASVRAKGTYLRRLFLALKKEFPAVTEVRGLGLLQGIVLDIDPKSAVLSQIIADCQTEGLLILRAGTNLLRAAPPLVISKAELKTGVEILRTVLRKHFGKG